MQQYAVLLIELCYMVQTKSGDRKESIFLCQKKIATRNTETQKNECKMKADLGLEIELKYLLVQVLSLVDLDLGTDL